MGCTSSTPVKEVYESVFRFVALCRFNFWPMEELPHKCVNCYCSCLRAVLTDSIPLVHDHRAMTRTGPCQPRYARYPRSRSRQRHLERALTRAVVNLILTTRDRNSQTPTFCTASWVLVPHAVYVPLVPRVRVVLQVARAESLRSPCLTHTSGRVRREERSWREEEIRYQDPEERP